MSPGIYLHLPFCLSRCRYCAFYSGEPLWRSGELVSCLGLEMGHRADEVEGPVVSVYLGGGTPGLLEPEQIRALLENIEQTWGLADSVEVTLEVNPAEPQPLEAFRTAGVTRLSVGVQALDDDVLKELGRRHTAAQAKASLVAATAAGFERLSVDLLLGLPDTHPGELARWVEQVVDLGTGHLSLYSLELHPGTALAEAAAAGRFRTAGGTLEQAQFRAAAEAATGRGLVGYEVSNFALPGQSCRHNQIYWRGDAYLGLGPGAHSFLPGAGPWGTRRWNDPGLDAYLAAVGSGDQPPGSGEELTREQALLERLFLALRCSEPLSPGHLAGRFGLDAEAVGGAIRALVEKGLLEDLPGGWVRPTRDGMRRADGVALGLHGRLCGDPGAA